jgi:hypothetical protein
MWRRDDNNLVGDAQPDATVRVMATKSIEDGIRTYLDSLGKSNKPVVDREAVKALQAQIRQAADPIEKLKLLSALDDEREGHVPDTEGEKAVFIADAKGWAERTGVSVSAFQALGVPDEVLVQAGFDVQAARRRTVARAASSRGSGRSPRIPLDDVVKAAKGLGSKWTLGDLARVLNREPTTVRNYVNKLIETGSVTDLGDDPNHDGRGRAAKLYRLS